MKRKLLIAPLGMLLLLSVCFSCQDENLIVDEPVAVTIEGDKHVLNDQLQILDHSMLSYSGGQSGISFDESSGELLIDEQHVEGMDTGTVMLVKYPDGQVLLRKVDHHINENGTYRLQTRKAGMDDVFHNVDLSLALSPDYSNLQIDDKSVPMLEGQDLTDALTDAQGHIHPSRMWLKQGEQRQLVFSVHDAIRLKSTSSTVAHLYHQFDTDFEVFDLDGVSFILKDVGFDFTSDMTLDYSIGTKTTAYHYNTYSLSLTGAHKHKHTLHIPYSISSSVGVSASNTEIKTWFDVEAKVDTTIEEKNEIPLTVEDIEIQIEFVVGAVPVLVEFCLGLDLEVDLEIGGGIGITTGIEMTTGVEKIAIKGGGEMSINYKKIIEENWSHPIDAAKKLAKEQPSQLLKDFSDYISLNIEEPTHSFSTPTIKHIGMRKIEMDAMATCKMPITIHPKIGIAFYEITGPELFIPVGATPEFSIGAGVSIDPQHLEREPDVFVGWDASITPTLGIGGGIWFPLFDKAYNFDPVTVPIPDALVYNLPTTLKVDNKSIETVVNQTKEISVSVEGDLGVPIPLVFVNWNDGDNNNGGHWEFKITMTGVDGKSSNIWVSDKTGTYSPSCNIQSGTLTILNEITFDVKVVN